MKNKIFTKIVHIFFVMTNTCWANGCTAGPAAIETRAADANSVKAVLEVLNRQTETLTSYQGRIEYLFSQPLFESQSLRRGVLYYEKSDGRSKLRINFQTLKQDDEKEQKYVEHYVFDGVWLTHIDYQIKEVKRYQQAEPNRPVDAFELAKSNFPIIGFTDVCDLEKEFEINLAGTKGGRADDFFILHLKPRQISSYKDSYTSIEFWIDKKIHLPAKIIATSTEEDIYEIRLIEPKINEPIEKKVFEVQIPAGFSEPQVVPLKK
jgi:outer membrane lipoprotein-sorting protein